MEGRFSWNAAEYRRDPVGNSCGLIRDRRRIESTASTSDVSDSVRRLSATGRRGHVQSGYWPWHYVADHVVHHLKAFLYSVSMRDKISHLPTRWRLLLGFWLTDELFAICSGQSQQEFNRWYAAGVGGGFYLVWNIASFVGIVAGSQIPSLNEIGLDFAVAATFIALVFPLIRTLPVVVCVVVSLVTSVAMSVNNVEGGLMVAAIAGMLAGFFSESFQERNNGNKPAVEGK